MSRERAFPGSEKSPMSADKNTLFCVSPFPEQDWINTATFLFYREFMVNSFTLQTDHNANDQLHFALNPIAE